ncbi:MAG TPA: carboxypeptidase regulatory-like domain-containing protein [Propionicimonas sp.]|nr:carboxypeptidase regulatory-like domain-containing protein [Propionicimonas sp.]
MRGWALRGVRSIGTFLTVIAAALALLVFATPPVASAEVTQSEAEALALSGTLTLPDGTSPADGAQVCAQPLGSEGSVTCAYTGHDGHFTLTATENGLVATSYLLYADLLPYPITYLTGTGSSVRRIDALALDLASQAQRSGLDFSLDAGIGVVGSVSLADPDDSTEIQVQVCLDALVEFAPCESDYLGGTGMRSFSFRELTSDDYVVSFWAQGYSPAEVAVHVGDGVLELDPITLTKSELGSVMGMVVDSNGDPLDGVTVTATSPREAPATTHTDATGHFGLADLAADKVWTVSFSRDGYAIAERASWLDSGASVELGTVRLSQASSVTIPVQDYAGDAITGASLTLCADDLLCVDAVETTTPGTYTFTGLAPARYVLQASHAGFLASYYPGVAALEAATLVRVSEGKAVTLNPLTLLRPGTITGTTVSTDENLSTWGGYALLYDLDGKLVTTSFGPSFSLTNIWPGEYEVQGIASRFADGGRVPVTVGDGEAVSGLELRLTPHPTLSGAVKVDGAPVDKSYVTLQGSGSNAAKSDTDGGNYEFWLAPDTYAVAVTVSGAAICGPDALQQCNPSTISVADAVTQDIDLDGLGTLTGSIDLSAFSDPDTLEVSIVDSRGVQVKGDFSSGAGIAAQLDARLAPGTYTVVVTVDDTWTQRYPDVVITNGETITKNIVVDKVTPPTYSLAGTLSLPQPESSVQLTVVAAETSEPVYTRELRNLAAGDHSYTVPSLSPGDYKLYAETSDAELWYPNAEVPQWASVVTISDANRTGIDLTVPPTRVTVSGTVALPAGVTATSAADYPPVTLLPTSSVLQPVWATPDEAGHFTATVPAGHYAVMVDNSDALGTLRYLGAPIAIDSDISDLDISLVAGGALRGRVVGSDGIPIGGAEVTISDSSGGSEYATTDADGLWSRGGLGEDTVGIKVEADGFVSATRVSDVIVSLGENTDTGTITLTPYGRLTVRLVAPSEQDSAAGITMVVTDAATGGLLRKQTMAADGRSRQISGLPAGGVKIGFAGGAIDNEWWQDAATEADATVVALDADAMTTIVPKLTFHAGKGTISGQVDDNTGFNGHLSVSAVASGGSDNQTVDVDAHGNYELTLVPGTYFVQAKLCTGLWTPSDGCVGKSRTLWHMTASATSPDLLELAPSGSVANIDFAFDRWEFTATPAPRITGTPDVGNILSASVGMWGPAPVSLSYQWYRGDQAISGATGTSYTVTEADRGRSITVKVTGTKAGYQTTTKASVATEEVPEALTIVSGAYPTISGTAKVGQRLTAVPGAWSPSEVVLHYQWYASGVSLSGATSSTFTLTPAQRGKSMTVAVTGWLNGTATITTTSSPTVAVAPGTLSAKTPVISGKAKVGKTLKAKPGSWGPAPVTLRYQWYANGGKIAKATKSSYTIAKRYKGKKITVKVTGSKSGYSTVTKKSKATNSVR